MYFDQFLMLSMLVFLKEYRDVHSEVSSDRPSFSNASIIQRQTQLGLLTGDFYRYICSYHPWPTYSLFKITLVQPKKVLPK